jgi:predicted nucleic acid-binding protein
MWFEPTVRVTDCRDPKDDKYLELALAAGPQRR